MKTRVLDASGLLRTDLDLSDADFLVTNAVLQEILDESARVAVDAAIKAGRVRVEDPSEEGVRRVKAAAAGTGDLDRLSDADVGALALALEKHLQIVTDDYNIQNAAAALDLGFESATQEGIKQRLRWSYVCEGCGRAYQKPGVCGVCGTRLRRKAAA